ncbi:MAG: 3-oxoacyl-ACP reductase FabG [bacterium]|nr:3-oxoacyl-ACP reductase FabG [bacterium]
MSFHNKVSIITGGARGIGFAIAKRYLAEGARVALWDILEETLDEAREKLASGGGEVRAYVVDVTSSEQVKAAMDRVEADFGAVDIMVNNAGIISDSMVHKMKDDQWNAVINVNLKGVFNCGREAAGRMRTRGTGVIINTTSVVGSCGNIGQTNYAASKAGVIGMTKTWAKELGRKGVRVNAVAPGFIMTEMMETVPDKVLDMIRDKTPLNRLGQPDEIAAAFAYLASDDASFVTGQVLGIDGGLVL